MGEEFLNGDIAWVWLEAFGYEHGMKLMGSEAGAFYDFPSCFPSSCFLNKRTASKLMIKRL